MAFLYAFLLAHSHHPQPWAALNYCMVRLHDRATLPRLQNTTTRLRYPPHCSTLGLPS